MATKTTKVATHTFSAPPKSPLDPVQVLKASRALIKHMRTAHEASQISATTSKKPNLLLTDDSDPAATDPTTQALNELPIWLVLSLKRHASDGKQRLKPKLVMVPHALQPPNASILLIIAEPKGQRVQEAEARSAKRNFKSAPEQKKLPSPKDVVNAEDFPVELRKRITVMRFSKLQRLHTSFESRRRLRDSYDVILADERIYALLPKALGKPFYDTTAKRPLPVQLTGFSSREEKATFQSGRQRDARGNYGKDHRPPLLEAQRMAREISKAANAVSVHVVQSASLNIRIGRAGWTAEMIAENLAVVIEKLVDREKGSGGIVEKGWEGVKAIFVRGSETASLPVYMTGTLWVDGADLKPEEAKKITVDGEGDGLEEDGEAASAKAAKKIKQKSSDVEEAPVTKAKKRKSEGEARAGEPPKSKKSKVDHVVQNPRKSKKPKRVIMGAQ